MVSLVKKMIGRQAEKKEVLTSVNSTLTAAAQANVILLNGIAEGTDYTQRVGRSATHQYIEVNIGIYSTVIGEATATQVGDFGFWALVYDRQPNGAQAAFTDMFDDSLGLGAVGTDFRITSTNQDRFKILCREEWSVGANNVGAVASASGAVPYHIKKFVDLSKAKGQDARGKYSGTGGSITAIDEGSILFVCASALANLSAGVGAETKVLGQCKYRFTDM